MMLNLPNEERVARALLFAAEKHDGQSYGDRPYLLHCVEVANNLIMSYRNDLNEDAYIAALLHDTIEDTDTTYEEIEAAFNARIAMAVKRLSRDKNQPYEDYIVDLVEWVQSNDWYLSEVSMITIMVKISDLMVNMSNNPKGNQKQKYRKALNFLMSYVNKITLQARK